MKSPSLVGGTALLLLISPLSCRTQPEVPDQGGPSAAPAASGHSGGGVVELKPETVETLLLYDRWRVAAVRCDEVRLEQRGTRSERVFIETTVLALGGEEVGAGSLLLTRFTQGDSLLRPGQTYLVAGYDDQGLSPAYNLVEWIPIAPEQAAAAAQQAHRAVLDRRRSSGSAEGRR